MKLDTGAATNVIPLKTYNKLEPKPRLHNSKTKLKGYGGHKVEHVGKCQIDCKVQDQKEVCELYVVDGRVPPILELQACKKLGLVVRGIATVTKTITMESLSNKFKDVCEGLRCFQEPYHIELKEGAVPINEHPRKVLFGLREHLEEKLKKIKEHGVIQKMEKPTDWVNNLVTVEKKDGTLQLCLDPRELNKLIKRENLQIPMMEDVTGRLGGIKLFTVIDLKDAF